VVGGIGINWAADLTRETWNQARQRLLSKPSLANDDLQEALVRSFRQAIAHLEQIWWQTPRGNQMRRSEADVAYITGQAFEMLRDDANKFFTPDSLRRAAANEQVRQLLYGDEAVVRRTLSDCLATYLHGHDLQLVSFIDTHLMNELVYWFGEELKADRTESNRAWRAFQRLLLESLQSGVAEMQAEQQETVRALKELGAWAERIAAQPPEERERTGQDALTGMQVSARDQLLEMMARESGMTRTTIEAGLEQIARLMREELARLRLDLLSFLQGHGLAEGGAPLPVDLRHRFDRLLRDYTLFGGRADELAAMRDFLADPQAVYLFVSSPSGYGKTALLAQWARQEEVAYHFINRAYSTADEDLFLRNLCQQLAVHHGLGGRLPIDIAELRVLYPALLSMPPADGQPVVVLIDGLDEALNWELGPQHFPPDLADGVKLIFSAREVAERNWPRHLHLPPERVRQLTLGTMTVEDLRALLQAAGGAAQALADDLPWIHEAIRLSEGDPFYLKLMVEDVLNRRMRMEQIGTQPTGLDGYLKGWWDQVATAVRSADVRDVLGSLAAAHGGLRRDDLVAMFPNLGWTLDGVLSEVRRFVIGDEQKGYALSHPRFTDYVRRRVGPRALQTYTDALLSYCANWYAHRSPYALQYFSAHLLESRRYRELLDLVDTPFLSTKHQYFRSYTGVLEDLRNAVQAAAAIDDPVKMLGLALAHGGLQARVAQLATYDVIPLYARFGEPDRALAFTETIADETQRARALVAVARELALSDPDQAKQIIRAVLANWRHYPAGYECGTILSQVLTTLPEELIAFLESIDDFSPVYSLGNSTSLTYQAIDWSAGRLEAPLRERLRGALTRALSLPADERFRLHWQSDTQSRLDLRFLLVRLEVDPARGEAIADSEAAHIIVQAKRDGQEQPAGQLSDQTIERTIQALLGRLTFEERWALLYCVAAPHAEQFVTALSELNASDEKVLLLLDLAQALVKQSHDVERAKVLLFEALRVNEEIPEHIVFGGRPIRSTSYTGGLSVLLDLISAELASVSLDDALSFLALPEIATLPDLARRQCREYAIEAAARVDPEGTLRAAEALNWSHWAKAIIVGELARVDFEQALSIWRELDPDNVDKPKVLINILTNTPSSVNYARAREVLASEFEPEQVYQLYKVPVQVEIAARIKGEQPDRATAIVQDALGNLLDRFKQERWGRPRQEFFLVRIIPGVASCGVFDLVLGLTFQITEDYGLASVAAADALRLLVDEYAAQILAERFDLEVQARTARPDNASVARSKLERDVRLRGQTQTLDPILFHLHSRVTDPRFWRITPSSGFDQEIISFAQWPDTVNSASLMSLYLLHKAEYGRSDWGRDHVLGVLTAKAAPVYKSSVRYFIAEIKDREIRDLALVEACSRGSAGFQAQLDGISRKALRSIACVRLAAREVDTALREAWLKEAFSQAEQSRGHLTDEFTMDLLLEFVREAAQLAPERARQFSSELIASVLGSARAWAAHKLFELGSWGYAFSDSELVLIKRLSDAWVDNLEHLRDAQGHPLQEEDIHELAARYLAYAARSTLKADKEHGLLLIERAESHAAMVSGAISRLFLQCSILQALLASHEVSLWKEAVWHSLDFGEAIFEVFDLFCHTLLEFRKEDSALPLRLLETIESAEQMIKV
jgi:hypothetical protein